MRFFNKKRLIFVIAFLVIFAIYLFIAIRGEYLEVLGVGPQYIDVFKQNIKYEIIVILCNFVFLYLAAYITTKFIKRGLKKFFDEEKKEMPKLPNKTIAIVVGVIVSVFTSGMITEKVILATSSVSFGITDPIFHLDIAYYMFQKPFIEFLVIYFIGIIVGLAIYTTIYYILVFNRYFNKGIDIEILKKNTFIKQLMIYVMLIAVTLVISTLLSSQNVVFDNFLTLPDGTSLRGAGILDVTIKLWGYILFAAIILACSFMAVKNLRKGNFKRLIMVLIIIPSYLIVMFLVLVFGNLVYVKNDEFNKEKQYIQDNMQYTKAAYDINIPETIITSSGTITSSDINKNEDVINNINLVNSDTVLTTLKEYQTNLGYYSFTNTTPALYKIGSEPKLVYITPREIANNTKMFNNSTYEYTHGFGAIITDAAKTDDTGMIEYIQKDFDGSDQKINITEPRIYFGLQTNSPIVTNAKNKVEYDYPLTASTNAQNAYDGMAGLNLNFLDRLILGIKEGNLGLAFSSSAAGDSKILTKRNVLDRAKTVLPYIEYDQNPYMVITDDGRLVWVIDGYTMSDNYPYSQESVVQLSNGYKEKINYIRNSIKVLVDAYNGTMQFYITDSTDPIAMVYQKLYPTLFKKLHTPLPADIAGHVIYPKYLYNVQAQVLKKYHDVRSRSAV